MPDPTAQALLKALLTEDPNPSPRGPRSTWIESSGREQRRSAQRAERRRKKKQARRAED
jgi:hypothetical protein